MGDWRSSKKRWEVWHTKESMFIVCPERTIAYELNKTKSSGFGLSYEGWLRLKRNKAVKKQKLAEKLTTTKYVPYNSDDLFLVEDGLPPLYLHCGEESEEITDENLNYIYISHDKEPMISYYDQDGKEILVPLSVAMEKQCLWTNVSSISKGEENVLD